MLGRWNHHIIEIYILEPKKHRKGCPAPLPTLICRFDSEAEQRFNLPVAIVNMIQRDDWESCSSQLGIEVPFDIAFLSSGQIIFPDGSARPFKEEVGLLWRKNGRA